MKPITEEHRQELIATIKKWLPIMKAQAKLIYSYTDSGRNVEIFEIALASLTAEPVAEFTQGERGALSIDFLSEAKAGDLVYTAPPVSVINLPEYRDYDPESSNYREGVVDGYNRCLREVTKMNGIVK